MQTVNTVPNHIAIVMDGNRRWATARDLSPSSGHREGVRVFKMICAYARTRGVRYLSVFALSVENLGREAREVNALLEMITHYCRTESESAVSRGIRVVFVGDRSHYGAELLSAVEHMEHQTANCTDMTLILGVAYGGRGEILRAVEGLRADTTQELTDETLRCHGDMMLFPDPDMLIRTGGEYRLSNFALYSLAYTELFFTATMWPDFTEKEFDSLIDNYYTRRRRFGIG